MFLPWNGHIKYSRISSYRSRSFSYTEHTALPLAPTAGAHDCRLLRWRQRKLSSEMRYLVCRPTAGLSARRPRDRPQTSCTFTTGCGYSSVLETNCPRSRNFTILANPTMTLDTDLWLTLSIPGERWSWPIGRSYTCKMPKYQGQCRINHVANATYGPRASGGPPEVEKLFQPVSSQVIWHNFCNKK